jgi:hypothetical protein
LLSLTSVKEVNQDELGGGLEEARMLEMLQQQPIVATPELLFKLSKKIAQLTRVIYHVHQQNDLHESEVIGIVSAYENLIIHVGQTLLSIILVRFENDWPLIC